LDFVAPFPIPAKPNWNWQVGDRQYQNVVITKIEADVVHITYDGGLGTVNTADLPPDIQKQINYNPTLAKKAAEDRMANQAQVEAVQAQELATSNVQNATDRAKQLRAAQIKLAQLRVSMDSAHNALLKASSHVNAYGVRVVTNSGNDPDGGSERAMSIDVLNQRYADAADAYNAQERIVEDLQK
jgi:hypothetical protein